MDKLEKFIAENRDELDPHEPPEALWGKLNEALDKQQPAAKQGRFVPIRRVWQAAAAVAILVAAGTLAFQWYYYGGGVPNTTFELVEHRRPSLAEVAPELAETEQYYISQIGQKKQQIKSLSSELPDKEFEQDLAELERSYQDLKNELYHDGNYGLSEAMIQNLQLRMDILNQQIEILQQIKEQRRKES
jgi:hypothetical protein